MEHQCTQEGKIAALDERTNNFNRRFDEIKAQNEKMDTKLDNFKTDITKEVSQIISEALVEKNENKWKHRINIILASIPGGAAGGGGVVGILKALGII